MIGPNGSDPMRWPLRVMVYGDPGSKKSTFAATFPQPILIFAFDPFGKERPYLRLGEAAPLYTDDLGTPVTQVLRGDQLVAQVEYYYDAEPTRPQAYQRFLQRLLQFPAEFAAWPTCVFDSLTYMEMHARKQDQYKTNRGAADKRQHYAFSTEALEDTIGLRIGAWPMNVVVIAHVTEKQDQVHGNMLYNPAAPGQLSKKLPAGFTEQYHAYVVTDEKGVNHWLLQTEKSGLWNAASQIPAPNPCAPTYEALWQR